MLKGLRQTVVVQPGGIVEVRSHFEARHPQLSANLREKEEERRERKRKKGEGSDETLSLLFETNDAKE